jgi:hypothetical protein
MTTCVLSNGLMNSEQCRCMFDNRITTVQHCMKLRFLVIFSKTIRDLQIYNMEVLDT